MRGTAYHQGKHTGPGPRLLVEQLRLRVDRLLRGTEAVRLVEAVGSAQKLTLLAFVPILDAASGAPSPA